MGKQADERQKKHVGIETVKQLTLVKW